MSARQLAAAQTRTRLLDAAEQTLRGQGMAGLTLDAVAKEAGVSKGGLLHHFPSKDALVEGILRRLFAAFEARAGQYFEREAPAPGRWLRAYVRASFDDDPFPLELSAVLLASVAENGALLALIREDFDHWQRRLLDDGVPPARATVIRQAADASWIERALAGGREDHTARLAVLHELLELAAGGQP